MDCPALIVSPPKPVRGLVPVSDPSLLLLPLLFLAPPPRVDGDRFAPPFFISLWAPPKMISLSVPKQFFYHCPFLFFFSVFRHVHHTFPPPQSPVSPNSRFVALRVLWCRCGLDMPQGQSLSLSSAWARWTPCALLSPGLACCGSKISVPLIIFENVFWLPEPVDFFFESHFFPLTASVVIVGSFCRGFTFFRSSHLKIARLYVNVLRRCLLLKLVGPSA